MILLNGHSLTPARKVPLEKMNLEIRERQSTAGIVPADMTGITTESWFRDDTNPGKDMVWRVKSIQNVYATSTPTVTLEHIICTLKDKILFGDYKPEDISGGETCTALQAIQFVLNRQSDWRLGQFDYNNVSGPYKFDGETLFDALTKVSRSLDDSWWTYDTTQYPFVLNIIRKPAGVACEMRAGRNLNAISKTVDKSTMYTRFYPIGKDDLHISGDYVSMNENLYGTSSRSECDQSLETEDELRAWANERLRKHAVPTVEIQAEGVELADATGENLDRLTLGRICRVPLPEFGTIIEERITILNYRDKVHQPGLVQITMSNQSDDVSHDIADVIAEAIKEGAGPSGRGGGGRGVAKQNKEDHAWFEDTDEHVAMCAEGIIGRDAYGNPNWTRLSEIIVDGKGIHQSVVEIQNENVIRDAKIDVNEKAIVQEVNDRSEMGRVLQGKITVEADRITQEVSRATLAEGTLQGKITVEANRITQEVNRASVAEGLLSGRITTEANRITAEVARATTAEGVLDGKITVEANRITAEVTRATTAEGTLDGKITVEAGKISAEVTRAKNAESSLSGRIDVEAGKITQIVSAVGSNGEVTAASICLAINNGGSTATINAGKIYLLGDTIANTITADYISGKVASLSVLNVKAISSSGNISVSNGYIMAPYMYLGTSGNASQVANAIKALHVVQDGNNYKIQKMDFDDSDWVDVPGTFSRATTLTGAWSSGVFTVSASPQGNTKTTSLTITNSHKGVPADEENAKHMYAKVSATIGSDATVYDTGKEIDLNASDIYDDGYTAGYAVPTVSGSWASGVFTATASNGNSQTTSLTVGGHWGVVADQEDHNTYYGKVSATVGSSAAVVDTGKTFTVAAPFTLASVTLQGASEAVYITAASGGYDYYKADTAKTYYESGSQYKSVTRYKSGGSVIRQGSAGPKIAKYNSSAMELYYKNSGGTYTRATSGSHIWYYDNSNGTQYYEAGSSISILGDSEDVLVPIGEGETGSYFLRGSSVSVTPIKTDSKLHLLSTTRFKAGSTVSDTYYTRN